ncbi:MAG: hypothetical protein ACTMH5_11075 [Brachybacterium sp.]|uniref:hypothetical protein n=1 Tax=Brachybacterium sp. TaxID=1891286 RepID=UPI003F93F625
MAVSNAVSSADPAGTTNSAAYLAGIGSTDERSLAAESMVSIIPIVIFFLILQRQIMDGMKGSVKG